MQVLIPGEMTATVRNGKVEFTFMPAASHAGYFGEEFIIIENEDDKELSRDDFWPMVSNALVLTSQQTTHFICGWEE